MPLPVSTLPTGTVTIDGTEVPIRSLSRLEVRHLRTFRDRPEDAEPYILAHGANVSIEEATEFLSTSDATKGAGPIDAILALSGLIDGEADPEDPPVGSTGAGPIAPPSNEP